MIDETMMLIDNYYKWLKEKTTLTKIKDYVEITTPYIDRHNDYIQIYIKKSKDSFILTDDGYTIDDLLMSGVKLDSPKRKELLKIILNGFGVSDGKSKELYVNANIDDFPLKKHNLIQAMLAVNDMFYTANVHAANLFLEDVKSWMDWMDLNNIIYNENIIFKGKSGFDRKFDFVIKSFHEKLIKVINNLNSGLMGNLNPYIAAANSVVNIEDKGIDVLHKGVGVARELGGTLADGWGWITGKKEKDTEAERERDRKN